MLEVTSHVGRDLLQSARLFKEDKDVVWEYVVNSLQYVERGTKPKVQVTIRPRSGEIRIADNGRGMSAADLGHFFQMHGENQERQRGRPGRGKFGTGKSAAFGIARTLRVDTRRNGLRNVVELTREDIDASQGESIPVRWLVKDDPTSQPDGTEVSIEDITVKKLNVQRVVEYIERHLQSFRASEPEVAVNDHICAYKMPETEGAPRTFTPPTELQARMGDATLTINVSRAPLTESERGVLVTAGEGNTIAIETGGIEGKEFGDYLFGHIDVPVLDREMDGVEAFDSTRSMKLNLQHPVAAAVGVFIATSLESVRRELAARAREAAKSEQARRLAKEANRIADMLNQDFETLRTRLNEIRAAAKTSGPVGGAFGSAGASGDEVTDFVEGEQTPGDILSTDPGSNTGKGMGRPAPEVRTAGTPNPVGTVALDPAGGEGKRRHRPQGGFSVEYRPMGREGDRSQFNADRLTILINLDHPVVSAALGNGGVEDPAFRRLSYEVAFAEYAMGIGYRMLLEDPEMPADDLMYEVRTTLNRVSRAASTLYG